MEDSAHANVLYYTIDSEQAAAEPTCGRQERLDLKPTRNHDDDDDDDD